MEEATPTFFRRFLYRVQGRINDVRRAFREFLAMPTIMILLFMALAIVSYMFERSQFQFSSPIYAFAKQRIFVDAEATSNLLGNIAGSIITVTSITITLLLLIVQQSASNLTTQVFDQFLRRRSNQFYFGYFVGLAAFTLITLATVDEPFNPVFSASLVFFLTVLALFLLLVLFYGTIHQMRPPVILGAIHDHVLSSRKYQRNLIARTRRKPQSTAPFSEKVHADQHGFVSHIDLEDLQGVIERRHAVVEIVLLVSIGGFVAYQDEIAEVKLSEENGLDEMIGSIRGAIRLERSRDLDTDPAYGVTQLEQIAWTVLSPSKSNLAPGLQAIYHLRDLLARWAEEERQGVEEDKVPVVYNDDVVGKIIQAFESLAVIGTVSKEHQVMTAILETFSGLYGRLPDGWKGQVEDSVFRLMPIIQEYVITVRLEKAIERLIHVVSEHGSSHLADQLKDFYSNYNR